MTEVLVSRQRWWMIPKTNQNKEALNIFDPRFSPTYSYEEQIIIERIFVLWAGMLFQRISKCIAESKNVPLWKLHRRFISAKYAKFCYESIWWFGVLLSPTFFRGFWIKGMQKRLIEILKIRVWIKMKRRNRNWMKK